MPIKLLKLFVLIRNVVILIHSVLIVVLLLVLGLMFVGSVIRLGIGLWPVLGYVFVNLGLSILVMHVWHVVVAVKHVPHHLPAHSVQPVQ